MSHFRTCPKCRANYDPGERHICEPEITDVKVCANSARVLNTEEMCRQLRELALTCRGAESGRRRL